MQSRVVAGLALAGLVSMGPAPAASAAAGWSTEVEPTVRVHKHTFDKAGIDASGCVLRVHLHFDAPKEMYSDARNPGRNHYHFVADIKLKSGHSLTTPRFSNKSPGRRRYETEFDTAAEGCWGKRADKIIKLDVDACRGRFCKIERAAAR